jgi:hypothetical protein
LGVINVVGVITLSSLLLDPVAKLALYRQGLGFVLGLLPYLQTYAAAFFALPLIRLFVDGRRNNEIEARNDNRVEVSCADGRRLCSCLYLVCSSIKSCSASSDMRCTRVASRLSCCLGSLNPGCFW